MTESLWQRIEQSRERWNVLDHPFYQRWSDGELSSEELAHYAGQYRYAVAAIAAMSNYAATVAPDWAREGLRGHAAAEAAHISLWDSFVGAVDGDAGAAPNPETTACAEAWSARDGLLATLVRLYAIESGQPAISRTKLKGLAEHYGIEDGPGNEYFRLHEQLDVEHADEARALVEKLSEKLGEEALVRAAEAAEFAFKGNWELLDGVDRAFTEAA